MNVVRHAPNLTRALCLDPGAQLRYFAGMANADTQLPADSQCHAVFATTHWSMVVSAGDVFTEQAAVALERLCQTYWSPLYA